MTFKTHYSLSSSTAEAPLRTMFALCTLESNGNLCDNMRFLAMRVPTQRLFTLKAG